MNKDMRKIEINFPEGVEITNDDQRVLDNVAGEICRRYDRAHPGRVMWPAGVGFKVLYMPMTRAEEEAGQHMEFAEDTFAIDCAEREDYSWPCAKCGIEQGEHASCIIDGKAGACEFEPAKKDLGPEPVTGLVPMHVYLSAVNGRREMRAALRKARDDAKDETGWVIEREDSEKSRPMYYAGKNWEYDNLKAVRFARREDAELMCRYMFPGEPHRIADHMWCAPRASASA